MSHFDERLDLWIETRLLRRPLSRRYKVPGYSKYPNKALGVLSDLEMPFSIKRRPDLQFEVMVLGKVDLADSWDDLAFCICRLIFRAIEGVSWKNEPGAMDVEEDS